MMQQDRDHYEAYYADKLWQLLPAVYRAEDSTRLDQAGPLREMVNRIGVQAAILRRSIDRLWADQSIETCDDWVIAYLGDLLNTNLVASLDARGQRLDVAKTIYYRRRKGTVALLEELAHDVTGWEVRVVEFFRRLSRNHHGLDPEIGLPAATPNPIGSRALQQAQGLVGPLTNTPLGGWADLRHVYGAAKTSTAFDEFYHLADVRQGQGQLGWYAIPRLGVFLWRLRSFGVNRTTPMAYSTCPDHYSFDPTGREIPLFAAESHVYEDRWVSPAEWQLPGELSAPLLQAELANLYACVGSDGQLILNSVGVFDSTGDLVPIEDISADLRQWGEDPDIAFLIDPARGRLIKGPAAPDGNPNVTYHYGFSACIGAGPYDRLSLGLGPTPTPELETKVQGGGDSLNTALSSLGSEGALTLEDSLTYTTVSDVTDIQAVTLRADNHQRPLIRLLAPALPTDPTSEWVFTGSTAPDAQNTLILEGLFISGGDIVLRGAFDQVILRCCTLDPGEVDPAATLPYPRYPYGKAVDLRPLSTDRRLLVPCHLYIEGQVNQLIIDRCILGPIYTRADSSGIQHLIMHDSIVQAVHPDEAAFNLGTGITELVRCTVLGKTDVHRLMASGCILDDLITATDAQHSCLRFSAWATGSTVLHPYECVEIRPIAPLFTSRVFGQPGYAQLQTGADRLIQTSSGGGKATLLEGAEDGSEMGAFAREKNAIKQRSLRIKYDEFMPLGLSPVLIPVT